MLGEERAKNKENIFRFDTGSKDAKDSGYLMQSTLQGLKQEIHRLNQQKNMMKKESIAEVDLLRLQLQQYKRKLSSLTDKYLLQTFMNHKDNHYEQIGTKNQQLIRQKEILYSQQLQKSKKLEEEIKRLIQQNCKLKKEKSLLSYEKQRAMEISLTEKIQIQEKNKLLQEEVKSKKTIISNLKKELQKVYSNKQETIKKQRAIVQKSKELQCFSNEINEYNRLSQAKFKQKLQHLGKQNEFLKSYIKKLQKMAKKSCQCEEKDWKVKENLFEIKRQLALAKVRLGQSYLKNKKAEKKVKKSQQTQSDDQADDY